MTEETKKETEKEKSETENFADYFWPWPFASLIGREAFLLYLYKEHPKPKTVRDIQRVLTGSFSTIGRIVDQLEEGYLIEVKEKKDFPVRYEITLSDIGFKVAEHLNKVTEELRKYYEENDLVEIEEDTPWTERIKKFFRGR